MKFNEIEPGDVLLANDHMTVILFTAVDFIDENGYKFAEYINLATGRRGVMTLDSAEMNKNSDSLYVLRGDQVIR